MTTEICPVCGTKNENLNLRETGGTYECIHCGTIVQTKEQPQPLLAVKLLSFATAK